MSTVTPTMRAIVVDDKKNLAVEEVPTPRPHLARS